MDSEFACPRCDSPSVTYPDEGEDRVVCAGCGAFLATRSQFRRLIEPGEKHSECGRPGPLIFCCTAHHPRRNFDIYREFHHHEHSTAPNSWSTR
jgi:hypothetical protein